MRLDERIIDCDDLYITVLDAVNDIISLSSATSRKGNTLVEYIRIAEDNSANTAKTVDADKCFRHYCVCLVYMSGRVDE